MRLKALPILAIGACSMLIGCNKDQTLTYAKAKEWVKTHYGEKLDGAKANLKKTSTTYFFGGHITEWSKNPAKTLEFLRNHLSNFIVCFTQLNATEVGNTSEGFDAQFSFKCEEKWVNENIDEAKSIEPLRYENFDTVLDNFFTGLNKYDVEYVVSGDTLTVKGIYHAWAKADTKFKPTDEYYDILKLSNCAVTFNKNGTIKNFKIDFNNEIVSTYKWYESKSTTYDDFSWQNANGGYLNIDYEY